MHVHVHMHVHGACGLCKGHARMECAARAEHVRALCTFVTNTKAVRGIVVCKAWFAVQGVPAGAPPAALVSFCLSWLHFLQDHLDTVVPVSNEDSTTHAVLWSSPRDRGCLHEEQDGREGCTIPLEAP